MTLFTPRPQWIVDLINELAGTGGGTWGAISGTLSNQTDLQTALDAKVDDSQISSFGASLIDDADAAAARNTLGLAAAKTRLISFFFTTTPTSSEVLLLYTACEAISLADDFAGSVGDVGTNPTASFVLDVQKNGSSVGTITISTGGAFTFATTGGAVSLASGDQIKIVAPSSADATCANVSITLKGEV